MKGNIKKIVNQLGIFHLQLKLARAYIAFYQTEIMNINSLYPANL